MISYEALHKKTPQEITALLYEAILTQLEEAKDEIKMNNMMDANRKLQQSNDILYRLGAGLNYEAGIIAEQLDALYNYAANRLIEANIEKNIAKIDEVIGLLTPVIQAWQKTVRQKPESFSKPAVMKHQAYEKQSVFK
ncbi:flagellar export chaperone FliS [Salisediminibacterium halotolerans]|uniref:Flagellar protein FliS n=1 Tax=Salisediminibacterium halotolerans TaxID=517425 RepID=A0A1H9PD02_9BACI|nr:MULTISPECIES: flagellar export chaperone FliS [Salisediminibacterium]RLJ78043.1 flagellar protein FliS [Actinophytocola xinjiangensis]RPE88619.1 flagellar protein FliS [Salisediminibacterium halotolerans]TWG37020.1 flagellar protein FliS [Salisediminibacterium halotolerans]SER46031.1 flagellar protein FliS [Salisediminibacterium haloalkalitolerans]GEL08285.1 hypothetical protein SHA02_17010 [Salisediminibacterium halotolerans]